MSIRDDLLVFSMRQWATHHDRSQDMLHCPAAITRSSTLPLPCTILAQRGLQVRRAATVV